MTDLKTWLEDALKDYQFYRDSKVCVVSIIGKAPLAESWTKGSIINDLVDRQVFEGCAYKFSRNLQGCKIDLYFDPENQCVFLNLQSPYELNCRDFEPASQSYHEWWLKQEVDFASNLLFLFSISQILLFVHPTCRFDLSYLRLFRLLNSIRENTITKVHDVLVDISGVNKYWATEGRSGCPRVLFLFHRPPSFMKPDGTVETKRGSYRKIAACLEDQIYKLFRKSRVITNNTAGSVCSLPQKQSFCYVFAPNEEPKDTSSILLGMMGRQNAAEADKRSDYEENGFKRFFFDHLDLALTDGFDDNIGKVGPAYFELPKFKGFVRAATALYDFFVSKRSECSELLELENNFDVITKFSENRCTKVYPMALASYQDGLPAFYSELQHRAKLLQAVQVMQQQARGPALEKAVGQLAIDCEEFWRNGRRSCESYSLTGNICLNRLHRLSIKDTENEDLPMLKHDSSVKYLSTCDCGRSQAWRSDPFDVFEANYRFYELNDFLCCQRLHHHEFPVYRRAKRSLSGETGLIFEQNESSDATEVDDLTSEDQMGQKINLDELFGNMNIGVTTQDELTAKVSGGSRVSIEDFLMDRDNRPASKSYQDNAAVDQEILNNVAQLPTAQLLQEFLTENSPSIEQRVETAALKNTQENILGDQEKPSYGGGTGSEISDLLRNERPTYEQSLSQDEPDLEAMLNEEMRASASEEQTELVEEKLGAEPGENALEKIEQAEEYVMENPNADDYLAQFSDIVEQRHDVSAEEVQNFDLDELESDEENVLYLSGMVHSHCPAGLLPLFPSWALICIGHSSLYSHSSGLRDQPNFSHGSQFLLPWDVTLPSVDLEKWHETMEAMMQFSKRPSAYKKPRLPLNKKRGPVSIKVFIGFEYECPRGHRFTLQSPDKILKHSGPGGPKDNGAAVALSDMPLWFQCSCSSQRQAQTFILGQLMRLHIVTPKAPVLVVLNARVQPQISGPVFTPGFAQPVKLDPAQYWVLRLPFCYHAGPQGGPLYPPKDKRHALGRILRSSVGVVPNL